MEHYLPKAKKALVVQDADVLEQSEVTQAILTLPIMYRELIILHYYSDYKLQEIADILEMPLSTVKTRHARAKKIEEKINGVEFR
ncbi:MAG: hypothetical protein KBT36_17355 [Kurthia sp.]|nr:hypothetical protein [Candidatus Kurthia equi]